jgi:Ca2+-transporting ATPase
MMGAQLLLTYLPVMNWRFHTAPIGWMDWLHIVLVGLVIYLVIGVEKAWRLRRETGAVDQ